MGPTPVVASPVEDIVPEGAPISDDDSVVSSVYSVHSEPEGEFWDDLDNHVPGPPPAPIIHEGAGPNVVPERDNSDQPPEGAPIPPAPDPGRWPRGPACQYPPSKCVNFFELKRLRALGKLNREMFTLTLGPKQIPAGAHTMSKK